jgi:glucosamine-phosphate N-acetyltransferase
MSKTNGERLVYNLKELTKEDLQQNFDSFRDTLKNLREVGGLSIDAAINVLSSINSQNGHIFVAQKEDGEIIGAATLLIEQKFIRQGGKVGHVEDVATRSGFEGKGVGRSLMARLNEEAKKLGCYKIILDCSDENVLFYEKTGYKRYENCMRMDL